MPETHPLFSPARLLNAALMLLMCGVAAPSLVLAAGEEAHAPLIVDTELTLSDVVDAALASYPAAVEQSARLDEAEAWQARGRSLMSGQPALSMRYQTDRFGDDRGLQEIETGIQVALWKWGQRRATRRLGGALRDEADAALGALRWEVAGLIRELTWELADAESDVSRAREAAGIAHRLETAVARRHALGDVAERDLLLARAAALDSESTLARALARQVDAERTYRTVTGLGRRPERVAERQSPLEAVADDHPALRLAGTALARAQSARTLARRSGSASPTLTIGPRRERSIAGQPFEDSIGIFLTVPFGGRAHVDAAAASAGRDVAAAQSELRRLHRDLGLALHEAEHELDVARDNAARAGTRAALARRGYTMGETAYAAGEIGLVELLALRESWIDAQREADALAIAVSRQVARYNQAVGVLP